MTDPQPCRVIGVLDDGAASLSATALAFLRRADWVIGGARTLALLDDDIAPHAIRRDLTGQLSAVAQRIARGQHHHAQAVGLGFADPFGHLRQRAGEIALHRIGRDVRGEQGQRARAADHQLRSLQVRERGAPEAGLAVVEHAEDSASVDLQFFVGVHEASAILRPSKSQTSTFSSNRSG